MKIESIIVAIALLSACLGKDDDKHIPIGPCTTKSQTPCFSCPHVKWLDLVTKKRIYNEEATCFNMDPPEVPTELRSVDAKSEFVISTDSPDISREQSSLNTQKNFFFRYASSINDAGKPNQELDYGHIYDWYVKKSANGEKDADFELLEWPGPHSEEHTRNLITKANTLNREKIELQFSILEFMGETSKTLSYPCSTKEGVNVKAIAILRDQSYRRTLSGKDSSNKIWLNTGTNLFSLRSIQPLMVKQNLLKTMISHSRPECSINENAEESNKDFLKIVYDFVFSTNRLILAMHCGILIVDDIFSETVKTSTANFCTGSGRNAPSFPKPITRISANVCCNLKKCFGGSKIVAAYSYSKETRFDTNKLIYISFDNGDTFSSKIVIPENSALNIVKGLYLLYKPWVPYYEILLRKSNEDELHLKVKELENLVNNAAWNSLTTSEKELNLWRNQELVNSTAKDSSSFSIWPSVLSLERKKESLRAQAIISSIYVPLYLEKLEDRQQTISLDKTPIWLEDLIEERNRKSRPIEFTQEKCINSEECAKYFVPDPVVMSLLGDSIRVMTPKRDENKPVCEEIVSLVVDDKASRLRILCLIGHYNLNNTKKKNDNSEKIHDFYAVYDAKIERSLPYLIYERYSKRIIQCILPISNLFPDPIPVQPSLHHITESIIMLITNCKGVIFYSTDKGRSWFNAVFYYKNENTGESLKFSRHYIKNQLSVPPLLSISRKGALILLTFRYNYGFGALNFNQEFRILIGKALEVTGTNLEAFNKFEPLTFPYFTEGEVPHISIPLLTFYAGSSPYKEIYRGHHGLRMVDLPHSIFSDIIPFYSENKHIKFEAREKKYHFDPCPVFEFSVNPKEIELDIGETTIIQVSVTGTISDLPLGLYTGVSSGLSIQVDRQKSEVVAERIVHKWNVSVTSLTSMKSPIHSHMDAFFASDYSSMNDESTNIAMVTIQNPRCHGWTMESVRTKIGCQGKKILNFEDAYRPQCFGKFLNNFTYTLKLGQYDPDMVDYWIKLDQTNKLFTRQPNGDLEVVYDYATFGCPVEPYSYDNFIPDIRIQNQKTSPEGKGTPLKGRYVLVEIFGAKGFSFTRKIRDAGCVRWPQNFTFMKEQWIHRKRIFNIAANKPNFMEEAHRSLNIDPRRLKKNTLFQIEKIGHPANIWNRMNYMPCDGPLELDELRVNFTEDDLDEPYEIMGDGINNEIEWDNWNHQRIYIFLVVSLDKYNSICEFHSIFGVSLSIQNGTNDILSMTSFFSFCFLWCMIIISCFHWRKRTLQRSFIEDARTGILKEAAWRMIYGYEQLFQDLGPQKIIDLVEREANDDDDLLEN